MTGKPASGRPALMTEWPATGKVRDFAARIPRPLRFLTVGSLGLATDASIFMLVATHGVPPLLARAVSLGAATLLTWRLNRSFTFDRTGRHQAAEAMRYIGVTATAQAVSYGVFALLIFTALAALPLAALVIGAAIGALFSYAGHRLVAFAPTKPAAHVVHSRFRLRELLS